MGTVMNLSLSMEVAKLHPCKHALRRYSGLTVYANKNLGRSLSHNEAGMFMLKWVFQIWHMPCIAEFA